MTDYVVVFNSWRSGFYNCLNNPTFIDIENPSSNNNYCCQIIQVQAGETYYYTGTTTNAARMYILLNDDETNNVVSIGGYNQNEVTNRLFVIPSGVSTLLVNADSRKNHRIIRFPQEHSIQSNTDLNTITTPGYYICSSYATAMSCINTPPGLGNGFRLDVDTISVSQESTYRRQIITSNTYVAENIEIFIRIYTTQWGDWTRIYQTEKDKLLDIQNLVQLEPGTDLDNVSYGSFYCATASDASSIINEPLFTNTSFSMYNINSRHRNNVSSYIRQFIFANKTTLSSIYTRTKNTGDFGPWQLMTNCSMLRSPLTLHYSNYTTRQRYSGNIKKQLRIMTNNVAHYWLQGHTTNYLADNPIKIDYWRNMLMKANADVLFLQECEDYIDDFNTREMNAFDYLYKPFFDSDHNIDDEGTQRTDTAGRSHASRRKILNKLGINTECTAVTVQTQDPDYQYNCYYSYCTCELENIGDILFINIHNFAGSAENRRIDRKYYLDTLTDFIKSQSYDYLIIAGDTNCGNNDVDRQNILNFCEEINATPVNGGILGWFITHNVEEAESSYDNIIVSNNIYIENIECDITLVPSGYLHTDHTPVIATINLV